jgi:hypothetical protein
VPPETEPTYSKSCGHSILELCVGSHGFSTDRLALSKNGSRRQAATVRRTRPAGSLPMFGVPNLLQIYGSFKHSSECARNARITLIQINHKPGIGHF